MRDTTEPPAVSSGASRAWPLVLLLGAFALALMAVAGLSPRPAGGELAQAGEAVIGVSGETVPGKLPRSRMVPATLRLGFTSEAPRLLRSDLAEPDRDTPVRSLQSPAAPSPKGVVEQQPV